MKFKGFDNWIEIFRGGRQTDSDGDTHDGDALINSAVAAYDPKFHEPPIVVGHPKDNAPAFGWVSGLKKEVKDGTSVLLAKFKNVVPEFADLVKKGLYKKRSASFYPDGRLRHVGFLGAAAPAVKGLSDIGFKDSAQITFEFGETDSRAWHVIARMFRALRDYIIEKEGRDSADTIIPDWNIEDIKEQEQKTIKASSAESTAFNDTINSNKGEDKMEFKDFLEVFKFWKKIEKDPDAALPDFNATTTQKTFSEADIIAAKKKAAEDERKKAAAEFEEKRQQGQREARDKEIKAFCDNLIMDKKIPPSWAKSGLVEFMQSLDSDAKISFAEGEDKKSNLQWFRDFLEGFGKSPIFKEMATKETAGDSAEFAEAKQDTEIGASIAARVNPAK